MKKSRWLLYNKVSKNSMEENGNEKAPDHQTDQPHSKSHHRFLVLLIAVYFVKGRVQAAQMKNELADAQQRVASQQAENDEIDRMLENSDYYLNQEARGENDYCDPEENVYVVVP